MNAITDLVKVLSIGQPQSFGSLTVYPLSLQEQRDPDYLTLDEALESKVARVTEISTGGHVPELRFETTSQERVLLVDGEELVGARQNRVLNLTILVGGHRAVVIPVSCVERGRWAYVSREFRSAGRKLFASARAAKLEQVSRSLRDSGERRSDQMRVWADVAETSACFRTSSSTESMGDIYAQQDRRLGEYRGAFRALPGQVGAVFAIGQRVVGLECFDAQATYRRLMAKLVSSYALDAARLNGRDAAAAPTLDEVAAFLRAVQQAAIDKYAAVGEGDDLRLEGHDVAGAALVEAQRVIHLAAFSKDRLANDY